MPFGLRSPQRLLREDWDSATDLAVELYAMMTAREPVVVNQPVEIRVREGTPGLRIVQGGPAEADDPAPFAAPGRSPRAATPEPPAWRSPNRSDSVPSNRRPQIDVGAARTAAAGVDLGPRRGFDPFQAPGLEIAAPVTIDGPVRFTQRPTLFNATTGAFEPFETTQPSQDDDEEPDPTTFVGLVTGGSASVWTVTLYPDGKDGDAGDSVTVTIPEINSSETPPAGHWIAPIIAHDNGTYSYQPPVWL